jgi:hypothetical protein
MSYLSHLINVSLKSTFSMIGIALLPVLGGPLAWKIFFHPFTLSQCLFLLMRWVSCKQQIVGSSFSIQFAKWCLLMLELISVTFSVTVDRYVLIPVI